MTQQTFKALASAVRGATSPTRLTVRGGDISRIAVTGGTGFMGRHLVRALADAGHEVVIVARGVDDRDSAVRRVADVVGRSPVYLRLPVPVHYAIAWLAEHAMTIPMALLAQVRILSEGIAEPSPFSLRDLRCCAAG